MKKAAAAAVCSVLLIAGCGGSGDSPSVTFPANTSTGTSTTAPVTPSATAAATTPATQTTSGPAGKRYTDPQGKYTITIGTKWLSSKGPTAAEYWFLAQPDHNFRPSLNITTEDLTGPARGISPDVYMAASVKNLEKAGFKVLKKGTVRGFNTDTLGAIDYTGKAPSGQTIHLLALFDLNADTAAVVTMASSPESFPKQRAAVQPYMRTLKVGA